MPEATFEHAVLQSDHRGVGAFTARGRNRDNCRDRQGFFRLSQSGIKIPEVAFIANTHRDRLRGVNRAAAAEAKKKIYIFTPGQLNPFINQSAARIRLNTAQFAMADACLVDRKSVV